MVRNAMEGGGGILFGLLRHYEGVPSVPTRGGVSNFLQKKALRDT